MDSLVGLGVFTFDESTVRTWLADPDSARSPWHFPCEAPTWTPLGPGGEDQTTELIAAAQQHHHLTGPGTLSLLFTPDADGDAFRFLVELTLTGGPLLCLASPAYSWETIAPEQETGIEAAVTVLGRGTSEANTALRQLHQLR
ncbi:hypothetical protein E1293_46830 [Actinomadura darangshiensis]|uniref:Uncharacterized protein n=1 Tax=Actinomadura darangshiensis TaxID=705336 RepID=A0A4R4ZM57_9ACTN|nr:hypothetical protein [Actinomadura darangshiensis]TDD58749.1 hypothetical protein E1293_46830 [Actinomadura darangshiensis]